MNYLDDFLCEKQIDEFLFSWEDFEEEEEDDSSDDADCFCDND